MLDSFDRGTTEEYSVYRRIKPSVTFVINREVVSPVLFRNSKRDRAETQEYHDTLHAQVNTEKLITPERLTGLHTLRTLTKKFADEEWDSGRSALINQQDYTHNEYNSLDSSANLDGVIYGAAGVENETFSMKSHVTGGYIYTFNEYNIADKEVRNAVYESGTMKDEDWSQSDSLYEVVPVKPGNKFVGFQTLESATPEMVLYVLHNILNTAKYGARETRHGKVLENNLIGIITSDYPVTLSSSELIRRGYAQENTVEDAVTKYIEDAKNYSWNIYSNTLEEFQDRTELQDEYVEVASREREDFEEVMYQMFLDRTNQIRDIVTD